MVPVSLVPISLVPVTLVGDLPEVAVREVPPEFPSVVTGAVVAAGADGSPSRDRLARIAAMIRDAERAMAGRSPGRPDAAELIPLSRRRRPARPRRRGGAVAVLAG